ncbi:hydroxymethylbilane synthase [Oscillospiraceae bacterium PP1C4]
MQSRKICIGSRESRLAVVQSELVMADIRRAHPELELELVTMKTTGDVILDRPLDKIGGKGLFVKELDQALLDGRIDLSVHSLKDMPMEIPCALPIVAYTRRADPRDVLILPLGIDYLDPEKPIGCSSARRCLQLQKLYPQMHVESVRGNVITRLAKLDRGDYAALVLAHAGISRLGLDERISRVFLASEMIPAAGQGIIAVQGRAGEDFSYLNSVNDASSQACAVAERSFVRTLNGGCSSPIAAYAEVTGGELVLTGLYYDEETGAHTIGSIQGETAQAELLGEQLAARLGGIR